MMSVLLGVVVMTGTPPPDQRSFIVVVALFANVTTLEPVAACVNLRNYVVIQ